MEKLTDVNKLVPTIDEEVKSILHQLEQPITRFGEGPGERRERLIELVSSDEKARNAMIKLQESSSDDLMSDLDNEEFYTPGTDDVFQIRSSIADDSLRRAQRRVLGQHQLYTTTDPLENLKSRRAYYKGLKSCLQLEGSQIVSNRFTSAVQFSPDDSLIAAASWNGSCYIYDSKTLDLKHTFKDLLSEKVSALDWMPDSTAKRLATGGAAGKIKLVDLENRSDGELDGHQGRITDVQFHPICKYLCSSSYDLTWRLWDLEKMQEIYYQEGHSKELTVLKIHPDGSLLASAGLDAMVRVWDLRTGRSIAVLSNNGHIKAVHAMDWRPSGFQLITGGADNNLKVWDLRKSNSSAAETVLAHSKMITDVKVASNDKYFVSCGYDGYLDVISCDNFVTIKKFKNIDKLMTCDVSHDSKRIITGGWDRSLKLYQ
ncbi:hypothetical protein FOA43_002479 [Brettanomyces nanus]|uniref:Pre-mRNA processing factor 4 (PRP4)-like domain-containing protein n=1 Tax=Eeniella nana TaxID=13502 RepID=A0A875S437_EENNA|nr:uncharacterized protein FOA43_002479 [Brettanomyces nanus]QPG75135.1 hypothetical protein FOA43_002479 [Brettanomyces nanus]